MDKKYQRKIVVSIFSIVVTVLLLNAGMVLGKTTLVMWDQFTEESSEAAISQIISGFQKKYPDVEIKRTAMDMFDMRLVLRTALASGTGPDVIYYGPGPGWMGVLAEAGMLRDLSQDYEKYGWVDKVAPGYRSYVIYKGREWAIPHEAEFMVVYCNPTIFDKLGIDVPESFEDLVDISEKIKGNGYIPFAQTNKGKWSATHFETYLLQVFAGNAEIENVLFGEGSWTGDGFVQAAKTLQEFNQKGYFVPYINAVSYDDGNILFYTGKAAMHLTGTWLASVVDDSSQFKPDLFRPPFKKGSDTWTLTLSGSAFMINSQSKFQQEALTLLDYFISPEAVNIWVEVAGWLPAIGLGDVTRFKVSPLIQKILALTNKPPFGVGILDVVMPAPVVTVQYNKTQELLGGSITAEEFTEAMQEAWEEAQE